MARNKRGSNLGLHTQQERDDAMRMAMKALESGVKAVNAQDIRALHHWIGYIEAIRDLAENEGAIVMVSDLEEIIMRLHRMGG